VLERQTYFNSLNNLNANADVVKKGNKENSKKEEEIPNAAPRTLSDIFRISNTNRKKNKLRKKTTKFVDSNSSRCESDAAPPANISQLIKM
jgi:hypothetical protein